MPRLSIDYSKTIIYIVVCKDPNITDCYVGSTTDFKTRKSQHKSSCNNETQKSYNINIYQFIREHNGWDNFDMIEIEKYNAIDQPDQARRERYWLEYYNATLNKQVPSRTNGELRKENKEKYSELNKEWRKENKEYISERNKEYREENREYISERNKEYREKNREQLRELKKEWYEQNREQNCEKHKEYREVNREQIRKKQNEKITCECGIIYSRANILRHNKSKKHQLFVLNICSNNLCG